MAAVAAEVGATPGQVALAWLLAQGQHIVPIPGTKRVARVEENVAADAVELTAAQVERLTSFRWPPAITTPSSRCGCSSEAERGPSDVADEAAVDQERLPGDER